MVSRNKVCFYRHCKAAFVDSSPQNSSKYCCPEHQRREKAFRSGLATDETYFRENKILGWRVCQKCRGKFRLAEGEKVVRCPACRGHARQKICPKCDQTFTDTTLKNTRRFCESCKGSSERRAAVSDRLEEHRSKRLSRGEGGRIDDFGSVKPFTTTWWGRVGEQLFLHLYPDAVDALAEFGNLCPFDATHKVLGRVSVKTAILRVTPYGKPSWNFQLAGGRSSSETAFLLGFDSNRQEVLYAWLVPTSRCPTQLKVLTPGSQEYVWSEFEVSPYDRAILNRKLQDILSKVPQQGPAKGSSTPDYERVLLGKIGEAIYKKLNPEALHVSGTNPLAPYDFVTPEGATVNVRLRRRDSRGRWTFFRSRNQVDSYAFIGLSSSALDVEAIFHVPSDQMPDKGFSVNLEGSSKWHSFAQPWSKTSVGSLVGISDLESLHVELTSLRKDEILSLSDQARNVLLDRALRYHRMLGFPYPSIPSDTRLRSEVALIRSYRPQGKDLPVDNSGLSLCSAYMPHRFETRHADADFSALGAFNDDLRLKRALGVALLGEHPNLSRRSLRTSLTRINKTPTNFRATVAKALVEIYCPQEGLVLDPCAGWGGRLMGTLVSGRRYTGVEPSQKTVQCLYQLGSRLCEHLAIPRTSFSLIESPIQAVPLGAFQADFAITSPPYWTKELYADSAPLTVAAWVQDFLAPLFVRTRSLLKAGSMFAVNIADVRNDRHVVPLEALTLETAAQCGFSYEASWRMLKMSSGFEPILVFRAVS